MRQGVSLTQIDRATAEGLIPPEVARELKRRAGRESNITVDSEVLGSVTSLADLLCAGALLLAAVPLCLWLISWSPFLSVLFAPGCWALGAILQDRPAFGVTRLLLFLAFTVQCALAFLAIGLLVPGVPTGMAAHGTGSPADAPPMMGLIVASGCVVSCFAWWGQFATPVAFPAGCIAGLNVFIHIARMLAPDLSAEAVAIVLLGCGMALLAVAIWWDMTDVRRQSWRTDVALWLHLAGGYQLAAASYRLIFGVAGDPVGWERLYVFATHSAEPGEIALGKFVLLLFVTLAVVLNRRSLIFASLAFLLPAMARLPEPPLGGFFLIGAGLIMLTLCWAALRALLIARLPLVVQAQLPRTMANRGPSVA